tara:strand:- start:3322 stop:4500 length:1179 start_codon:yes stop_codon:yes gene_type:complete
VKLFSGQYLYLFSVEFILFGIYYLLLSTLPIHIIQIDGTLATVGIVMGIAAPIAAMLIPISGYLIDNWNDKKMIAVGLAFNIGSLLFMPLIKLPVFFVLVDLTRRFGTATTSTATRSRILEIVPQTQRGEGLSVFTTSHNLGTALMPPIGLYILGRYGFTGVTTFCILLIIIGLMIVKLLDEPSKFIKDDRRDLNNTLSISKFKQSLQLKTWIPPLTLLMMVVAFFGCLTFIPLISEERSIPNYYSFFTVYGLTVFVSRLFVGKFSDRYGREIIIIPCILICSLAMVVLAFSYTLITLWVTAVMFGVGWGCAFPTLLALASDYSFENAEGQTQSIMSASFSIGTALGGAIIGLVSETFTFEVSFLVLAALLMLTLLIFSLDFKSQYLIKTKR